MQKIDFSGLISMIKPTQKAIAIRFQEINNKIVYGEMDELGYIIEPIELVNIDSNFNGYDFCQGLYDALYERFPNEIETVLDHHSNGEYTYQLILMETGYMIFFPKGERYQDWFLGIRFPELNEKSKGTK